MTHFMALFIFVFLQWSFRICDLHQGQGNREAQISSPLLLNRQRLTIVTRTRQRSSVMTRSEALLIFELFSEVASSNTEISRKIFLCYCEVLLYFCLCNCRRLYLFFSPQESFIPAVGKIRSNIKHWSVSRFWKIFTTKKYDSGWECFCEQFTVVALIFL